MNYLTLMSYTTRSWSGHSDDKTDVRSQWFRDLVTVMDNVEPASHQVTSILALLSASVTQGNALPPFLSPPPPYNLNRRLEALDKGILDSRHITEPAYSAYAVMQVASSLVSDDLARLVDHVKDLVGETDFSFRVAGIEDTLTGSDADSIGKGKKD